MTRKILVATAHAFAGMAWPTFVFFMLGQPGGTVRAIFMFTAFLAAAGLFIWSLRSEICD